MVLGIAFLFIAALWALPLAGVPVLLHMLFQRKSPIVFFSTLRFVKQSMQQTAARRRIQKWLLLACRMLLLAILIWAVAQPVRFLTSGWFTSEPNIVAAIVVDTSYSMLLKQQEMTLLDKANDTVQTLLREPLKNARVAIFKSQPAPADAPEKPQSAGKIQSEWIDLKPGPSPKPLGERVNEAVALLSRQQANQKWLVIITDMQSREFATPLPEIKDTRIILFDLQPDKATSNGITRITMKPEQPIAGVGSEVNVEVSGRAGDAAFVDLTINKLDGTALKTISNLPANFESTGRTKIRVPLEQGLPPEQFLLLAARLQREDDLPWDNTRSHLVELPPKQNVTFIETPSQPTATKFIRFALSPYDDLARPWPLYTTTAPDFSGQENAVVWPITDWPNEPHLVRLRTFVKNGGSAVLLLQPGLESSYEKLTAGQKSVLAELLPARPAPLPVGGGTLGSGLFRVATPARPDPILEDIVDPTARLNQLVVRRFVPFEAAADPSVTTLLYLSPKDSDGRAQPYGFYYRRTVGAGTVYLFATLPDSKYCSPPTHPAFPIQLIKSCLRPPQQRDVQNVEIGRPLILAGSRYANIDEFEVQGPGDTRIRVKPAEDAGVRRFVFPSANEPGLYYWRQPNQTAIVAVANVQLPSDESDLNYRPALQVVPAGENVVVARSYADLLNTVAKLNEPEPHWTLPIVLVLMLICVEALLASLAHLWKGKTLGSWMPAWMRAKATAE